MWMKEYKNFHDNVDAKSVWNIMIDIEKWPEWHDDLEFCKMHGEFKVGSYFWLKPKGAPKAKIFLTEIDEGNGFTDCTHFFGARMYDQHSWEKKDDGVVFHHKIWVTGILSWFWIWIVAKNVARDIPEEINNLALRARKMSKND